MTICSVQWCKADTEGLVLCSAIQVATRQPVTRADAVFQDQMYLCLASLPRQVTGITVQVQLLDISSTVAVVYIGLHTSATVF